MPPASLEHKKNIVPPLFQSQEPSVAWNKEDLEFNQVVNGVEPGTLPSGARLTRHGVSEEDAMPVILLWGIPALFVVAGGGWWLMHMHH
jgi:hypothetical protein